MAVVRSNQNALVIAGPGAGKTELLAQRASFLLETGTCAAPSRVLAISFKRDAARNLKDRVARRCGPRLAQRFESYTFDAWAKGLLDRFRPALLEEYRPTANYAIDFKLAEDARLQARLLSLSTAAGFSDGEIYGLRNLDFYREHIANVPIKLDEPTVPGTPLALTRALWHQVLHSGQRSVLDFQMIGALAELILRTNPKLLFALRSSYRYIFLDEFQDTTRNQFNLLSVAFLGSASCLTAVGDNKQRIMLWAGARNDVFEVFRDTYEAHRYTLSINYRSAPRLIAIQNHLITEIDPEAQAAVVPPESTLVGGECRILIFEDDDEEATHIAELINVWVGTDHVPPEEICILVRQRPDMYAARIKNALAEYGVAVRVQDAMQDLLAEPLVRTILNALSVCCKTPAPVQWNELRDEIIELQGLSEDSVRTGKVINNLSGFIHEIRPRLEDCASIPELVLIINDLLSFLGRSSYCLRHERYIQAEYLTKTIDDCAQALIAARSTRGSWPAALDDFLGVGYIAVMSIHKSKGLEYHSVVLLGLEDYPFLRGLQEKNGEEECNIFVAFSRAKQRVVITSVKERFGRGQTRSQVGKFFAMFKRAGVEPETL